MDEGLVAGEEAVPSREEVAFEPTLAEVLGEDLHDPAVGREPIVAGERLGVPRARHCVDHGAQPVRVSLVRADYPEVAARGATLHHVGQVLTHDARGLGEARAGLLDLHRELREVAQVQLLEKEASVRVGARAHAQLALGRHRRDLGLELPRFVEELPGPVALEPGLEELHVLGVFRQLREGHLVRSPRALGLLAVHRLGAGPALGRAKDDHRPGRTMVRVEAFSPRLLLDRRDVVHRLVQGRSHEGCIFAGSSPSTM